MTNFEIITSEAIAAGIYTKEEAEDIISQGYALPIHTYNAWKRAGYQVRKGEKAKITTRLWKHKTEKTTLPMKDVETGETHDVEQESGRYYLAKAFLFTADQVDRIAVAN